SRPRRTPMPPPTRPPVTSALPSPTSSPEPTSFPGPSGGCFRAGLGAAGEDLVHVEAHRAFELVVGTRRRYPVRPPPDELRGVPEPVPLHVVVGDLADQLRPEQLVRDVLLARPAARRARYPGRLVVGGPRVVGHPFTVRRQLVQQFTPPGRRERRGHPDVVQ